MIILIIMDIGKQGQNGTIIFNILDNTTELWMTKYKIGEIVGSDRATLYKNPSDQTVFSQKKILGFFSPKIAFLVVFNPYKNILLFLYSGLGPPK